LKFNEINGFLNGPAVENPENQNEDEDLLDDPYMVNNEDDKKQMT
jgi:hypothetical protein